jgi:hypothetical protein
MDFFQYKDFNDFIIKNNFTVDQGLEFLDKELEKRSISQDEYRKF